MKSNGKAIKIIIAILSVMMIGKGMIFSQDNPSTFVDKNGVLRWTKTHEEIKLFGVNYTAPFAYAYRALNYLGIPHEKAIDEDVYHLARLGFDAFRVHVWDCEISDSVGNLLSNDHLRLFDYQIKKMKERGMKFLITPMYNGPNGYPEPPEKTPGFSTKYGKANCLVNPDAIKAMEQYLFQFGNHVNPFTGIAYKDDPDIIAFEICNEPHHQGTAEETTNFIDRMVNALKRSGSKKPIFYNVSHSIHLAAAYFNANIQGGTFQWYPSGLVRGQEIGGNYLPNADIYPIPFADNEKFKKTAKVVYEFDAADIGRSYMYPYMAKSFREAGFQFATQFDYDPLNTAYANTEYQTHYMNLAYAPQKALSLKIAGEAFRMVPIGKKKVSYPKDSSFMAFRVSYKNDLAEMITDEKLMYTNHTNSAISSTDRLKQIAGFGNSKVVEYPGCGAYFLDRLEDGVWRLEVMPDAVWVRDPFEKASLKKEVSVIIWKEWPMIIHLPNLGANFSMIGLNEGNTYKGKADGEVIRVTPGTYLLYSNGKKPVWRGNEHWNNIIINEFVAPSTTCKKTYVLHEPLEEVSAGKSIRIDTKVVSSVDPESVELFVYGGGFRPLRITMRPKAAYTYTALIPDTMVKEGFLRYYISIKDKGKYTSYPSEIEGLPTDWNFYGQNPYKVRVVKSSAPVCIFNAETDGAKIISPVGRYLFAFLPSRSPGNTLLKVAVDRLNITDPENRKGNPPHDYSFKFFFHKKIQGRFSDIDSITRIVLRGNSLTGKLCILQVALVTDEGLAHGGLLTLQPKFGEYTLLLKDLKKVKTVTLPGAYPTFLPYFFKGSSDKDFDLKKVENIQFSIGPGIPENEYTMEHNIAIENVTLE